MWSKQGYKTFQGWFKMKTFRGCTNELGLWRVTDGHVVNEAKANVNHQAWQHSLCSVNICSFTSFQKGEVLLNWAWVGESTPMCRQTFLCISPVLWGPWKKRYVNELLLIVTKKMVETNINTKEPLYTNKVLVFLSNIQHSDFCFHSVIMWLQNVFTLEGIFAYSLLSPTADVS